jgi:hypothetical protein
MWLKQNTLYIFLFSWYPSNITKKKSVFTLGKALGHIIYWINRPILNATSHTPLEHLQWCSVCDSRQSIFLRKSQNVPMKLRKFVFLHQIRAALPWVVNGATQLCTSQKECNKLHLTTAQYFWLVDHNDWSRWFAISSPRSICSSSSTFYWWGCQKKKKTDKLRHFILLSRVTYWAPLEMLLCWYILRLKRKIYQHKCWAVITL